MAKDNFYQIFNEAYREINPTGILIDSSQKYLYTKIDCEECEEIDILITNLLISKPWIRFERVSQNTLGFDTTKRGYYIINMFDNNAICTRLYFYQKEALNACNNNGTYFNIPITKENDSLISTFCKINYPLKWRHEDYPFEDSDEPYYGYHLIYEK